MLKSNVILREDVAAAQQFFERRASESLLVDKSQAIVEFLSNARPLHLILRPRRSGKSTTLSMFKTFFEATDSETEAKHLGFFRDLNLKVYNTPQFERHFCKYTVLWLDFAGTGGADFEGYESSFALLISKEIDRQRRMGNLTGISQEDLAFLNETKHLKGNRLANMLRRLTLLLHKYIGRKVLLLIDEYDTPLSSATSPDDCLKIEGLLRHVFSATLKKNTAIFGAFIVGILKQPSSGFLSAVPDLKTFTLSSKESSYTDCFLYTEDEVRSIYDYFKNLPAGLPFEFDEMKRMYCGYRSGAHLLYNPWDIINAMHWRELDRFWDQSGDADFIVGHISTGSSKMKTSLVALLSGDSINLPMTWRPHLLYGSLRDSELFGLLFRAGYLTETTSKLFRIPNSEILEVFSDWIKLVVYRAVGSLTNKQKLHSVLESAVNGPSSEFRLIFPKFLADECRSCVGIRNCQRFLVFGVMRFAVHLNAGFSVRVYRGVEEGALCFTLAKEATNFSVFYLFDSVDESSLHNSVTSGRKLANVPAFLSESLPSKARECRVYGVFFWKGTTAVHCSYWSRKLNGVWKKSRRNI